MSIGKNESASETVHVITDGRMSLLPSLKNSTQVAIKNGRLTNRNARKQKKDEEISSKAEPKNFDGLQ
jgi:hypothetical protein